MSDFFTQRTYEVGKIYNGLLLARIEDRSKEYPDSITTIYAGLTHCNELVFELINAPMHIEYEAEEIQIEQGKR